MREFFKQVPVSKKLVHHKPRPLFLNFLDLPRDDDSCSEIFGYLREEDLNMGVHSWAAGGCRFPKGNVPEDRTAIYGICI